VVAAVEPQVKARPIEVALIVRGVYTYFDLSPEKLTTRPNQPLPVVPEIEFTYSPDAEQK
jgi:hypothetical protein